MIVSSQHVNVNGLYVLPPQHSLRVPYPSSSAYGKRSGFCPEIDQFRAVPEKFKQKTYRSTSWLSRLISLSDWSVRYGRQGSCPCQNHPIGCGEECSSWIRPLVNHTQVFYRTRKCDVCSFPLDWLKIEIRKCSSLSTLILTAIDESFTGDFILECFKLVSGSHITFCIVILTTAVVASVMSATSSISLDSRFIN